MSTILQEPEIYVFHPNLRCKLQEKIASCDMALKLNLIKQITYI